MLMNDLIDLNVIPCSAALDGEQGHAAHDRKPGVVCPGTYLHEFDLVDRAAAYQAIARIAVLTGVDWPTMANSIGAVSAAGRPDAAAVDTAVALLERHEQVNP